MRTGSTGRSNEKPVIVLYRNGRQIEYPSVATTARALNLSASTVRGRLKDWTSIKSRDDVKYICYKDQA